MALRSEKTERSPGRKPLSSLTSVPSCQSVTKPLQVLVHSGRPVPVERLTTLSLPPYSNSKSVVRVQEGLSL